MTLPRAVTRSLTVVQILPALNAGGVERCTLETARALVAAGHQSIVVSSGGRMVAQLAREGSRHVCLPVHRKSLASLLQITPLRRLLRELKPDIVHARSRIPAWIAWLALGSMKKAERPGFITTMHGLHSVNAYSGIMTRGDAVIAGSGTVRDYILRNYPSCPPQRIRLIPEGVDPAEFPYGYMPSAEWLQQWRADFPQLTGKTLLALPGRLTRLKGHATFIALMAALKDANIHGLIIGGAEQGKEAYENELRESVRSAGLASRITFTGHRSDIRDVLSQCDLVFSLSTKPESFGRTVLETLRLGRPVIAWDIGGAGEILAACYPEGRVDMQAPEGPQAALLAATQRWLAAPGRPADTRLFLLESMCDSTLDLYQQCAADSMRSIR